MNAAALDLPRALDAARRAVLAGGRAALQRQERGFTQRKKPDDSPVTEADQEAEAAILLVLRAAFPGHAFLCEESGAAGDPAQPRWIVDPLDGTKGFVRGGDGWGPLVALEHRGELLVGAAGLPARGRSFWAARGLGCFADDGRRVTLARERPLAEAALGLGSLPRLLAPPCGDRVRALVAAAALTRSPGDVAALALLLDGTADAWLETGVQRWDVAAGVVLVEEAGGRCTDFHGGNAADAGEALGATPLLHADLLARLG